MSLQNKIIAWEDLGQMDYKACWVHQESLFNSVIGAKMRNRESPDDAAPTQNYMLFVEHPHVYTLGKSGSESHLLLDDDSLAARQASYYRINRGGDITYHGPGQLVVYPILDLDNFFTDIHRYLRLLEESVIRVLSELGIAGERSQGQTGVWIDSAHPEKARKICAMGVRCSRWVTMHGLALNVNADLSYFSHIVPCGIPDKQVTSIERELGRKVSMQEIAASFREHFAALFEAELMQAPVHQA